MPRTTETTYEADLAAALELLEPRIQAALIDNDDRHNEDVRKTVGDMLNDFWVEGLHIEEWADRAASHAGINQTAETIMKAHLAVLRPLGRAV